MHDGLGHIGCTRIVQHALHETSVDLQAPHRETVEVVEVGEAGAEVVHRQGHAMPFQHVEAVAQDVGVTDQRRLGQFQLQPLWRPAVGVTDLDHTLGETTVTQLHRRYIDCDAIETQASVVPGRARAARGGEQAKKDDHPQAGGRGQQKEI
ncbi:hypothetical protein G6F66_013977 [Rhizopus arrhizus]|nr:hypothetical protein G6F66_013977 [Rhizopus arrhizus]